MREHLPEPDVGRRLLHTRRVTCTGYLRDDGLFEFEGLLIDTKTYDARLTCKTVASGEPIHHLGLRLVVDRDLVIQAADVLSQAVPTPFCTQVNAAYAELVGLKIGPGLRRKAAERVGGVRGCVHLTELLGPLATTAVQTISMLFLDAEGEHAGAAGLDAAQHWLVGTCHVYRPDGEMVRLLWPAADDTI